MLDDQKKYKLALWISGVLPLFLFYIEFYLDCVWCYLDVFDRDRFYEESKILYSRGTTLAEFLEICEEMKKKEAMYQ